MLYKPLGENYEEDSEPMEFNLPLPNYPFVIFYYGINIIMITVFGFIVQLPADTLEPRILPAIALIFLSLAIFGISLSIATLSVFASIVNLIFNGLLTCNYLGLIILLWNFDFVPPLSIYFSRLFHVNFNYIHSYWAVYLFLTLMLGLSALSISFNWRLYNVFKHFEERKMDRSYKRSKKKCSGEYMKKILEGKSYELGPSEWEDVWMFNDIELSDYLWNELKKKDDMECFYSTRETILTSDSKKISNHELNNFLTLLWIGMKRLNIEILLQLLQRTVSLEDLTELFKKIWKCLSTLKGLKLRKNAWKKISIGEEANLTRDDIKEMLREIIEQLIIEDGIKTLKIVGENLKYNDWKVMLDKVVKIILKKYVGELLDEYDSDVSIENERNLVHGIHENFKKDLSILF